MKRLTIFLGAIGLIGLVSWGIWQSRHEAQMEAEREKPFTASSDIKDGVIAIGQEGFAKAGMALLDVNLINGKMLIPMSAILWWDGKAWIYRLTTPDHYMRVAIEITGRSSNELYEVSGLTQQDKIVVTGAQLLLSTELGSGIQMGEDD